MTPTTRNTSSTSRALATGFPPAVHKKNTLVMDQTVNKHHRLSVGGVLVALGIIYGDIGTSPIYTLKFIVGDRMITEELILGGLSCIFWTLTLITSIKYIYLALNADN